MKKQLKSLLLLTLLVCTALSAWSQSTEGKEFWVALTLSAAPSNGLPTPFIAVSTKKATTIKITNPNDPTWQGITRNAGANEWVIFESEIPLNQWYPTSANSINNIKPEAGLTHNFGLKVTTTEDVSLYAALWMLNSFDAANILPTPVLMSEYYAQDYPPYIKPSDGDALSMLTILATENNTTVTITPTSTTQDNHAANVPYTVNLNAGQTYYVISQTLQSLSGTHVLANGKKIAVFQGDIFTQIPGGKAARDCTYEQAMPIEYWGTQFIVTRAKEKDANRIRVTACTNGTTLRIDGNRVGMINAGETFEFEMHQNLPTQQDMQHRADINVQEDAVFLESSCPVAVYSYDVSNGYKADPTEMDNSRGDPSMVWISPIQQKINKITFGTCYTDKTKNHFVNVITETATCNQTKLTALFGVSQLDKSSLLVWTPVPGNPKYSYARARIGDASTEQYKVFNLSNPKGFNAIVYGNGDDESYAYSAGSAAVEQGVNVEGETFTDGFRSDNKFCLNTDLSFDAKVGTDEITSVDWTFGDGTSETGSLPQTTHRYTSPGWYDLTAELFGHQVCTDESNVHLGTVHFSFRVVRPDTVYAAPEHRCIEADSTYNGKKLTPYEIDSMLTQGGNETIQVSCADTVYITPISYGMNTIQVMDTIEHEDFAVGYNGVTYRYSQDVIDTIEPPLNSKNCTVYRKYYVKVIACAKITVTNDSAKQHICPGGTLDIEYTKNGGDIKSARFVIPGVMDEEITIPNYDSPTPRLLSLPTASITKPGIYKGQLIVEDGYIKCDDKVFDIDIAVYYPSDIFLYKFNNVLAVYKKGFGGNVDYDFKAYQWYLNYMPIEGATESVLYLGDNVHFEIGDVVYVALTDMKGVTLPSCGQTILNVPDYNIPEEPEQAPARKRLINNRFVIEQGSHTYDIYGQKVK